MISRPFKLVIKPVDNTKNLNFSCLYHEHRNGKGKIMSFDVLEQLTSKYIEEQSQHNHEIQFTWSGADPMLAGLDFFIRALRLQHKYRNHGIEITNILHTSATLMTDDWADFFKLHDFQLVVSIEGYNLVHKPSGVHHVGNSYHGSVISGYQLLLSKGVCTAIHCVIYPGNLRHGPAIYRYFVDELDSRKIEFTPALTDQALEPTMWGTFLCNIFNSWLVNDIEKVYVRNFEATKTRLIEGTETYCMHANGCGPLLAIECAGDAFPCDHVAHSSSRLGKVTKQSLSALMGSSRHRLFVEQSKKHDVACSKCDVKGLCQSGCPKHRDSGDRNRLCDGYYRFFKHVIPYLYKIDDCRRRSISPKSSPFLMHPKEVFECSWLGKSL